MAAPVGRFLTGSTMGHVVRMTATGAIGITFVFAVDAVNLFWLSVLGREILMSAVGYAFAIQFFAVSTGVGVMIAMTAMVSRAIGAGDRDLARRQATSGILYNCLVQTVAAAVAIGFRHELLALVGAEGEALQLAARYLALSMPSIVIMAIGLSGSAALRAEGDGRRAMQVTLIGGTVLLVVDPIFIVVMGLGLDGAALGIWIFRTTMAVLALYYCTVSHRLLARPSGRDMAACGLPLAAIALPAMATQMATPFGNALLTSVVAKFGDSAVAGWAVVNRLTVVAFGGLFALGGAIGGIFGQNFGAGSMDRVRQTFRDAVLFCVGYAGVVWLTLMGLSGQIAMGFGLGEEASAVLRAFTHVGAMSFMLGGLLFVANSAFNTLGRPLWASVLSWVREGVLMLPAALWLSTLFDARGAVYAQALVGAGMGVLAAWLGFRFVTGLKGKATPELDLTTRRAYRDVNRYRRR